MAIYALIRPLNSDWGTVEEVRDMGSHVPEIKPPLYWLDVTGYTPQPDGIGWWYDIQGDAFTQIDPQVIGRPPIVSPEDLWFERVADDERGKIFALAQEDGGGVTLTQVQRGRLKALLAFTTANHVPLENAEVIFIFEALETAGALAPGRAAEILS